MLDLSMAVIALFVCVLIVPAFILATGFAVAIPFFGFGLISQLWTKGRETENVDAPLGELESFDDWSKRQASTEEEVWRHTG